MNIDLHGCVREPFPGFDEEITYLERTTLKTRDEAIDVLVGQEMVDKILAGKKTVTRRPVKLEDGGYGGAIFLPCRYKPGHTYAIQPGRGKKAVGRLRVLDVRREPLGSGSLAEAHREGFATWWCEDGLRSYWIGLYGSYDPTQLVDRIEFERVPVGEGR